MPMQPATHLSSPPFQSFQTSIVGSNSHNSCGCKGINTMLQISPPVFGDTVLTSFNVTGVSCAAVCPYSGEVEITVQRCCASVISTTAVAKSSNSVTTFRLTG